MEPARSSQVLPKSLRACAWSAAPGRSGCPALALPGKPFCTAHEALRTQEIATATSRITSPKQRPVKVRRGDANVSDWLPLG